MVFGNEVIILHLSIYLFVSGVFPCVDIRKSTGYQSMLGIRFTSIVHVCPFLPRIFRLDLSNMGLFLTQANGGERNEVTRISQIDFKFASVWVSEGTAVKTSLFNVLLEFQGVGG